MAKKPTKKEAVKAAPSPKLKTKMVKSHKVTFGKGVTLGKGVS